MLAHQNLFRTERVLKVRYEIEPAELEQLFATWRRFNNRGALMGPEGSGKTTLLEDLGEHLLNRGFQKIHFLRYRREYGRGLSPSNSFTTPMTSRDVILIDGAEQLSWIRWQILCWQTRAAGGMIITTHEPGRLPLIWECKTSSELLIRIVDRLAPGAVSSETLCNLYRKHRGNIRDVLRELYDQAAKV